MASPDIAFNQIPSGIRKPGQYFEYNTSGAVNALPGNTYLTLIIGQRLPTGNVAALVATNIYSDGDAEAAFGIGSIAHLMARAALNANPYLQLTVIAVDDAAAGIAASGSVALSGAATASGNFTLYVAGVPVTIAVNLGDSANIIAADLVAQMAQQPDLPVSAVIDATNPSKIDITAQNKGLAGNGITLSVLSQTSGVASVVSAMAGGLSDPDIQPALTAIFGASYNILAAPFSTQASLTTLRTHLDSISGPMEQRPATCAAGWPGSLASATTLAGQVNEGRISLGWHNGSVLPAWQLAAAYAAVLASESDPAMPLNTLALNGLDVTDITQRPGREEQETALHNGVAPFEVGPGDVVQIVRAITTYTVDAQGIADPSLLDITTIRTLDYMRMAWRQRIALRFPRNKLDARTVARVRSELLAVAYEAQDLEIIQNVDANKDGFIVELDLQDPTRLDAKLPCAVVPGLHVFAGVIDLIL